MSTPTLSHIHAWVYIRSMWIVHQIERWHETCMAQQSPVRVCCCTSILYTAARWFFKWSAFLNCFVHKSHWHMTDFCACLLPPQQNLFLQTLVDCIFAQSLWTVTITGGMANVNLISVPIVLVIDVLRLAYACARWQAGARWIGQGWPSTPQAASDHKENQLQFVLPPSYSVCNGLFVSRVSKWPGEARRAITTLFLRPITFLFLNALDRLSLPCTFL